MAEQKRKGWINTVVTIAVLVIAYYIYRYNIPEPNEYIAYYSNVKGLQASSPVMIRGARVGKIKSISLEPNGTLRVIIAIPNKIQLHDSAKAVLASAGLISNKSINIIDTTGTNILPNGAVLLSDLDTNQQSTSVKITPYIVTAKYLLHTADSSLRSIQKLTTTGIITQFIIPLSSFEKNIKHYESSSAEWNNKTDSFATTLNSLKTGTSELAAKSKGWNKSLKNTDSQSLKINNSSIGNNIAVINKDIKDLADAIATAGKPDSKTGKYLQDKSAYVNTNKNIDTLNQNMKTLQETPPGFSIFGKKKKKK